MATLPALQAALDQAGSMEDAIDGDRPEVDPPAGEQRLDRVLTQTGISTAEVDDLDSRRGLMGGCGSDADVPPAPSSGLDGRGGHRSGRSCGRTRRLGPSGRWCDVRGGTGRGASAPPGGERVSAMRAREISGAFHTLIKGHGRCNGGAPCLPEARPRMGSFTPTSPALRNKTRRRKARDEA